MPDVDQNQLTQLRLQIEEHFNDEELRTLCFDVGVDFENLGGRGKAANVLELINWAKRKGRVSDLLALVKEARPNTPDVVALLPPHHIPYRKNELFTGREEWLAHLHAALHRDEPVAVTQAVSTHGVVGLGGVGKTQLALAYRLGLARRSVTDQPTLHQRTLDWLQTTDKRWLLVYDNADGIQPNELRPFLPEIGHGACLITSRNPNWGGLAQTLNLTYFSEREAVSFLLGQRAMTSEAIASHSQGEAARTLAALLGHLPLALEHARAYVEETGCTLADYADYFANERADLLADTPAPANYDEKTITTTWELAFAQAKQTPGAAALLNLCCFLAPDEIPLDLIMTAVGAVREPPLPDELIEIATSKMKLDKAIAALRRYSLLTRDGDTISLHGLVQTVARDQMPPELRQRWAELAVTLLLQAWPYNRHDLTTWERSGELLSHMLAAADESEKVTTLPGNTGLLLNQVGVYLYHRAAYDLTLNLWQRALEIDERANGSEHVAVAVRLNNLGHLLQTVGAYEAARPYLERALAIDEKALGPDHPRVATDLNNLGQLLQAEGEHEVARPYLERALAIFEKNMGSDHPNVATLNNNLGQLLEAEGKYEVARPYMERALAIWEKTLGPDHPQVATGNNNLGQLLKAVGEYEAARPLMERALAICEAKLGADHPNTNIVRGNLAALLAEMENNQ